MNAHMACDDSSDEKLTWLEMIVQAQFRWLEMIVQMKAQMA